MKKRIIFIVCCWVGITAIIVNCLERSPHDFSNDECGICHQGDTSGGVMEVDDDKMTSFCEKCHVDLFSEGYMHPVDVSPKNVVNIPKDFPLSPRGRITCNTCHDVHSSYENPLGVKSSFLRRYERGKAFCDSCHGDVNTPETGHSSSLGEAHFQSKYIVTDVSQQIDSMSKNCISCHDGSYASSVTINSGFWTHSTSTSFDDPMTNHPIGIDYEQARLKSGRKTDLRPIDMVDQRILFFDGKVGCGSCHNPYSYEAEDLVMTNGGSQLCFACHMIDG